MKVEKIKRKRKWINENVKRKKKNEKGKMKK